VFEPAANSVDAVLGPGHTDSDVVTLQGQTDPLITVELPAEGLTTTSDTDGRFWFVDVPLAVGLNALTVVATDTAGNTSSHAGTVERHDRLAPQITAHLANDTGRSDTDGVTSDPTVAGTLADASVIVSFTAALDTGLPVDVLGKLAGGAFTLAPADLDAVAGSPLADGAHTLWLQAEDEHGNLSMPVAVSFLLDRQAPLVPEDPDLLADHDTGLSDLDNITSDTTPRIRTRGEAESLIQLLVDGTVVAEELGLLGLATDLTPPELADGTYAVTIASEDLAGNTSVSAATLTLKIDTTNPAEPTLDLDPASDTQDVGDQTTTAETVTLVGDTEADSRVEILGLGISATADTTGRFELLNVPLELGENIFTVLATDPAGNTSEGGQTFTREPTAPPAFSVRLVTDTAQGGGTNDDNVSSDPTITGTVTSETGLGSFRVGMDNMVEADFVDAMGDLQNGTFTFDQARLEQILGAPLLAGPHRLRMIATDSKGTASEVENFYFFLDLTPPVLLSITVTFDAGAGVHRYEYVLSNPATNAADGDSDELHHFGIRADAAADLTDVITPAGWTTTYTAGDSEIGWAAGAGAALLPGESATFGFASALAPAETVRGVHRERRDRSGQLRARHRPNAGPGRASRHTGIGLQVRASA